MGLGEASLQLIQLRRREPRPVSLLFGGFAVVHRLRGRETLGVEAPHQPRRRVLVQAMTPVPPVVHPLDVHPMVAAVEVVIVPLEVVTVFETWKNENWEKEDVV